MNHRSRDPKSLTRRGFASLSAAGLVSGCIAPRRRGVVERFRQFGEQDTKGEESDWYYDSELYSMAAIRVLSAQAQHVVWRRELAPVPSRLWQRGFIRLEPYRGVEPHREGVLLVSDTGRVGLVDHRCRTFRSIADGMARVSWIEHEDAIVGIDGTQRVWLIPTRENAGLSSVSRPFGFDDVASQAWCFAGFVLVAYSPYHLNTHPPGSSAGVALSSLTYGRERGEGQPSARPFVSRSFFEQQRLRLQLSAGGMVMAKGGNGPARVEWHDWAYRHSQRWVGDNSVPMWAEPIGIARSGAATHILYEGHRNTLLLSFAAPGAKPRIIELPFEEDPPSPLEWTRRSPPWRSYNHPHLADAWEPLPGPDGRVALAPPGHVICYDAAGKVAWQFKRNGTVPAVVVKGGLLVEHDAALFVLDWGGTFRHVWTAPTPLTAKPLFHERSWYVATGEGLHRLR